MMRLDDGNTNSNQRFEFENKSSEAVMFCSEYARAVYAAKSACGSRERERASEGERGWGPREQ